VAQEFAEIIMYSSMNKRVILAKNVLGGGGHIYDPLPQDVFIYVSSHTKPKHNLLQNAAALRKKHLLQFSGLE